MRGGRETIRDLWEYINDKKRSVTETSASATSVNVYRPFIKGGREGTLACLAVGNGAANTTHFSMVLFLFCAVFTFGRSATLKGQTFILHVHHSTRIYLNNYNSKTKNKDIAGKS